MINKPNVLFGEAVFCDIPEHGFGVVLVYITFQFLSVTDFLLYTCGYHQLSQSLVRVLFTWMNFRADKGAGNKIELPRLRFLSCHYKVIS